MEDILASIRRIIADDQTQGLRSGYGAPAHRLSPMEDAEPETDRAVGSVTAMDRARQGSRSGDEGELDLASIPGVAFTEETPSGYDEPSLASNEAEAPAAQEPGSDHEGSAAGGSFDSLEEMDAAAPEQSNEYRNGEDPSSLVQTPTIDQHANPVEDADFEAPVFGPDEQDHGSLPAEDTAASGDALISPLLGASVMSAFETLAATVVLQNTEMLERTMRELLRPLVKTWLDENLPTLVERLVRNEIERVARGGRR